jgi:hypothetical protein
LAETEVRLDRIEAMALGQMPTFIRQWISGPGKAQLAASLHRFLDLDGYDPHRTAHGPRPVRLPARRGRRRALFGTGQP